ncbi:MAG: hypothetical protein ACYS0D_04580 [Planctomycetota bacterium]|jgi:flagellar basal body-associated protein FliL
MSEAQESGSNSKSVIRMILLVCGILFIEAVVILGAIMFLGGPTDVEASSSQATAQLPEEERIVEVLVLDGRLPNSKTGITYLYDVEIYVQVKSRYSVQVSDEFDQFRNEIKSDITAIWRQSDPREFQEPKLQSLTRKIGALLNQRFGVDPEYSEPIISKCVIVMGTGFRVDS